MSSRVTSRFSEIPELQGVVRRRRLGPDEVLFAQGEAPRYVYVVLQGVLKLTRASVGGRQMITELLFPGDACDLLSVFDAQPSMVSGVAVSQQLVEVEYVPIEDFRRATERNPQLADSFLAGWRERLQFQREMMVSIAVERVEQRALRALMMLAGRLGRPNGRVLEMELPLTRQEFSELIGTTMESAIRAMSSFRKQALIREEHGTLSLPPVQELRELCAAA